jgi:hypothetical protein
VAVKLRTGSMRRSLATTSATPLKAAKETGSVSDASSTRTQLAGGGC